MTDQWNAGDKVELTGICWTYGTTPFNRGDVLTLRKCVSPDEWEVEEKSGDTHLYVQTHFDAAWGAVKLATGGVVTPGSYPLAGEVRTTSSTGGEKGVKPEDYALIPWGAMDEIARVYAFGAQKYAAHNWRKGYEWGKSFSALCRHIFAFWRGEDRDPESNLSHLAHAGFHVLSLLTFWLEREKYGEHDDRYAPAPTDPDE